MFVFFVICCFICGGGGCGLILRLSGFIDYLCVLLLSSVLDVLFGFCVVCLGSGLGFGCVLVLFPLAYFCL
jgi:hypothetical protein